ncbi:MAG TPA: iron donor protein CyaY [Candidatus Eisenbacteria bacterium]|nr:iron donor protein CyaY [Candidatus Eisenbacteria bacterium]
MTEHEYQEHAAGCLATVARWIDRIDDDALDRATGDGLVAIEFEDGTKYVLNRQGAAHQMWFAAGARAWHYDWDGAAWVDDRDRHRLYERIAEVVGAKLGRTVPPVG